MTDIIGDIIAREGGYVDDPSDIGGATKFGVTLQTLSEYRKQPCTAADVEALSSLEAYAILTQKFVTAPGYALIADEFLRSCVVDAGVNHGPGNATKWLQAVVGATQDGVFGPATAQLVNAYLPHPLASKFIAARARFYGKIMAGDPTQAKFAGGWMDRLATFIEQL